MANYPPPSFKRGAPGRVFKRRPKGFDRLVTDLILAWASFDTGLIWLMEEAFEIPSRNSRILVGNMDIKGRIGKLKTLGSNMGFDDFKALMAQWESQYEKFVKPRNAICHMHFFGHIRDRPELWVFGPAKAERGPPRDVRMLVLDSEYAAASRDWALAKAREASDLLALLQESPMSELEEHLAPTPPSRSHRKQ